MNLSKTKFSTNFGVGTLVATALVCCGCDQIAGAIMEQAVVHSDSAQEDGKRDSFAAKFKKVQDACPKKINDYTTLQWVKMKGLNRIEYRYLVSESGRQIVNMNNTIPMEYEYILMTKQSPLADSVIKLDMSVDHIFRDSDDKQMLSIQVNKRHLKAADRPRPLFCYPEEMLEAHGIEREPADAAKGTPVEEIAVEESPAVGDETVAKESTARESTARESTAKESTLVVSPVAEFPTVLDEPDKELPAKWDSSIRTQENPAGVQLNPYAQ